MELGLGWDGVGKRSVCRRRGRVGKFEEDALASSHCWNKKATLFICIARHRRLFWLFSQSRLKKKKNTKKKQLEITKTSMTRQTTKF